MNRSRTEFNVLKAFNGDSILIKTFDVNSKEFIILIDGGTAQTFKYSLKQELKSISRINLLILTHIDSDHIGGLINFFKSSLINNIVIDEIWMNNPDLVEVNDEELISIKQGDNFKNLILEKIPETKLTQISTSERLINHSGIKFTILSPTIDIVNELYDRWDSLRLSQNIKTNISSQKNAYSQSLVELNKIPFSPNKSIKEDIFNSSSISFLLECHDISLLLLADSRSEVIVESLRDIGINENNPLVVDYVKVSHHGSLNNTSQELLGLINSNNYIISTNGGAAKHSHPSRETISRIVYNSNRNNEMLNIYFNYSLDSLRERIGCFINKKDLEHGNWNAISQNIF